MFALKSDAAYADTTMTMQLAITKTLAYVARTAMWNGPCPDPTFVASERGNVKALDRRHAG
jgi:hypothetical protein